MPQWRKIVGALVVYGGLAIGLVLGGTWFYSFFYFDASEMPSPNKMSFLIQIGLPIIIVYLVCKFVFLDRETLSIRPWIVVFPFVLQNQIGERRVGSVASQNRRERAIAEVCDQAAVLLHFSEAFHGACRCARQPQGPL
jgi:hypothetical protein